MNGYEALGKVYDRLNGAADHAAWADLAEAVFARYGVRPSLLLDLGCGTGRLSAEFARRGYDVIGVDTSPAMLAAAYARKIEENLSDILFLEQDMRDLELYGTVGAVVSSYDCVNYLTGDGDLDRCFSLVHNYLDPDGVFFFDVNAPFKFERVFGDRAYLLEEDGVFCAWQNAYDKAARRCRFDLSVFTREVDGRYTRTDEVQEERCYTRAELENALTRAGFDEIAVFGDGTFAPPSADAPRWFLAARCKK